MFSKQILFSNETFFWLNGCINKHNHCLWHEEKTQDIQELYFYQEKAMVRYGMWPVDLLVSISSQTIPVRTCRKIFSFGDKLKINGDNCASIQASHVIENLTQRMNHLRCYRVQHLGAYSSKNKCHRICIQMIINITFSFNLNFLFFFICRSKEPRNGSHNAFFFPFTFLDRQIYTHYIIVIIIMITLIVLISWNFTKFWKMLLEFLKFKASSSM